MFQLFLKVQNKKYVNLYRISSLIVWFWFGMFGKIFSIFGNHQAISEQILSIENGFLFIKMIGLIEILFGLLLFKFPKSTFLFFAQIILVFGMNVTEFILAKNLLLLGELNLFLACFYIAMISTFFIHSKKLNYAYQ